MKQSEIKKAIAEVEVKVRHDKRAGVVEAIIAAEGKDLPGYIEDVFYAHAMRGSKEVKRAVRTAGMNGAVVQLEIEGLEHATLPAVVPVRDADTGFDDLVKVVDAPVEAVEKEIKVMERMNRATTAVLAGLRSTIDPIKDVAEEGDTVGEAIGRMRQIEPGNA